MNSHANRRPAAALLIALLLLLPLCAAAEQQMTVFAVTSTASAGPGTLEAAVAAANALPAGSSFQVAIEVDGTLPAPPLLDLTAKTGWIKSRPGATLDRLTFYLTNGGALTLENAVIDNRASDLPAIRVSNTQAGTALLLKGNNRIMGSGSSNIYVAGTLEIDRAPLTSDADGTLTLTGTHVGIYVAPPGALRMRGGTVESNGEIDGIMGAVSVASGKLIASGGSRGINCDDEADQCTVYGGTIVARAGGTGPDIAAARPPLFAGGSIDARSVVLRPIDEADRPLFLVTLTVGAPPVVDGPVFCWVNGALSFSARTDAEGKLYLWMPAGEGTVEVSHDWRIYRASGTVAENDENQLLALQPVVTAVVVSPASAKATRGASVQFTATVEGEPPPPQGVTWTVVNGHEGTSINDQGLLTISKSETARTLTVTATSAYDPAHSGAAQVTVAALSTGAVVLIAAILLLLFLLAAFLLMRV